MKWRSFFHYLLVLPLWAAFLWAWWLILFHWPRTELIASFRLVAFVSSVCGILITLWVRHNIAIFKRKGPRQHARQITMTFTSDALGRPLVLARPGVLLDSYVIADVEDGKKVYRPAPSERLDPEGLLATVGSG